MSVLSRSQDSIREHVAGQMPVNIHNLIAQAKSDLWDGPLYLDADGEQCSSFDHGAHRFDFCQACGDIADFFDGIGCLYLDEDGCVHTSEPTVEDPEIDNEPPLCWEVSRRDIVQMVVGEMLAPYIA